MQEETGNIEKVSSAIPRIAARLMDEIAELKLRIDQLQTLQHRRSQCTVTLGHKDKELTELMAYEEDKGTGKSNFRLRLESEVEQLEKEIQEIDSILALPENALEELCTDKIKKEKRLERLMPHVTKDRN